MEGIPKDIIIRAREGDIHAFKHIYDATSGFVYTVAVKMTRSREDAEEVTQDVFLRIHKHLGQFQFKSSFKTWLYRIAVNITINFCKKRMKRLSQQVPYNDEVEVEWVVNSIEQEIEDESSEERVRSLLEVLNADQRACVILRDVEGLRYEEIAETLSLNINTVRTRLKRARERLLENSKKRGVIV